MTKNGKIAIGAIFKDEFNYILEWIAWHKLAGFSFFYIADNGSTDGTTSLLEAISEIDAGVTVFYQPTVDSNSQERAYNTIHNLCSAEIESILFIDADEFLAHDSYQNGAEYIHLENILNGNDIGMVAINWRCYGSSGFERYSNEPVVERFTHHCADIEFSKNHYIKSASKIAYTQKNTPHFSSIDPSYKMVDVRGGVLNEFIVSEESWKSCTNVTGISKKITSSPLRINHYVIKSRDEFNYIKAKRGRSWGLSRQMIDENYFKAHDYYDQQRTIPQQKIADLILEIRSINNKLLQSTYSKKISGHVDISNTDVIIGWASDENGSSAKIKINIFINGVFVSSSLCKYYRKDVMSAGKSTNGFCGFKFQHPKKLNIGDRVLVLINANSTLLKGYFDTIVDS